MQEQIRQVRKEVSKLNEELKEKDHTMQLLEKSLDHSNKRRTAVIRYLVGIIGALLLIDGFLGYKFATTTVLETTTEQSEVYNFTDSEGNVISSDLSLDEMKELIELNGEDQENNSAASED